MSMSRRELFTLSAYGFGAALLAACGWPSRRPPTPIPLHAMPGLTPIVVMQALQELGFAAFADRVKLYQDETYLYVESSGLPTHPMMKGIRSWPMKTEPPSVSVRPLTHVRGSIYRTVMIR